MKPGRALELLVRRLEDLYVGQGVVISSPDYLVGQRSGKKRQVDVTLRAQVGSSTVVVAIECKDRSRPLDVEDMEQLCNKFRDIAVRNGVVVSTSGYTDGAIAIAAHEGVETRTLDDVGHRALDWFDLSTLHVGSAFSWGIREVTIYAAEPGPAQESSELSLGLLVDLRTGQRVHLNEVLDLRSFTPFVIKSHLNGARDVPLALRPLPEVEVIVLTPEGSRRVAYINVLIELGHSQQVPMPLNRAYRYQGSGQVLAEGVELDFGAVVDNAQFIVDRSANGQQFSVRIHHPARTSTCLSRAKVRWFSVEFESSGSGG